MATTKLNDDGRIKEFSYEDIFDLPLSNPDYVNETCIGDLDDFIYVDGEGIFSPRPEKIRAQRIVELQKNLSDTDYYAAQILESFLDCDNLGQILQWMKKAKDKYGEMIKKRFAWREELQELLKE